MCDLEREQRKPGYWAILPASVRYHPELTPSAKLLYAEVSAMSDRTGYCWAQNSYLAELFGLSPKSISRLLSQLAGLGLIRLELGTGDKGIERKIWLADVPVIVTGGHPKNEETPSPQKCGEGHPKNEAYNNIYINNNIPPYSPPTGGRVKARVYLHKDHADWMPDRFAALWTWYPHDKRGSKQRAIEAWDKLKPDDTLCDTIAAALLAKSKTRDWQRGVGIPHVSTYLNGYRWEEFEPDELAADDDDGGEPIL